MRLAPPRGDQVGEEQPPHPGLGGRFAGLPAGQVQVRRVLHPVEVAGLAEEDVGVLGEAEQRLAGGGVRGVAEGPAVVFPEPNERFITSPNKGEKKFRAIELNPIQGIYVKVISDYSEGETQYKAGEELFITGETTPIYFPREEHSLIKYDNKTKHYATAIPAGEGRYVMDRMTGEIAVVKGPAMELPDPRTRVSPNTRRPSMLTLLHSRSTAHSTADGTSLSLLTTSVGSTRRWAITAGR